MTECLEGGCRCGAVRYRLMSSPLIVHCCHCTSCQAESGTAFAVNAMIEAERVVLLSGALEPVLTPSDSGMGQQIWRCAACRIAVWSNYGGTSDVRRFVRVGTLDHPAALPPDIHIFTRSKLPWVILPTHVRAVPVYYERDAVWPPDKLARLRGTRPPVGA